ncbi:4Fe-4S binding protein [Candidatus Fermentibacteria bacterium]|nr:4Fe-4S binding protein [Candidatus Fermentibacteria bacterium]
MEVADMSKVAITFALMLLLPITACLSASDGYGPAPVMGSTALLVDTGYTPGPYAFALGEYPVFVLHWEPADNAAYYLVAVSPEPITSENFEHAVIVDSIPFGQDSAWVTLQPGVFSNTCIGCGQCVDVCPHDAIVLENGRAVIDLDLCTSCGQCVLACPVAAISDNHYGKFYHFALRAYSATGTPSVEVAATAGRFRMIYKNDPSRCARCNNYQTGESTCYMIINDPPCPVGALEVQDDFMVVIDYDKCIHCGRCFIHCRTDGLYSMSNFVEAE